jgi:hypothetical protein
MKFTTEDMADLRSVINEQFDSIQRLGKIPIPLQEDYKDFQDIYQDILECNKVMMEIISGPSGGIEKLIERNV